MKKIFLPVLIVFIASSLVHAQDEDKLFSLKGYITTMQSAMFDSLSGPVSYNNLIHNRLNFRGYFSKNLTFGAEVRNRLFTGDLPRSGDFYYDITGADNGWADMSWNIIRENSFFLNTTIDRLWLDLNFEKVQVCIGRQRINWGQTFVWNPNDIFNAYSFFDFDYAEKPGSDAVRLQYYPSSSSVFEMAVKAGKNGKMTAAGLYRFNKAGYDIQLLGGYSAGSDIVAGAGWSGPIGNASFRGEASWFYPASGDHTGTIVATAGIDKIYANNSMLQMQVMYSNQHMELNDFNSFYSGNLSAKDLAFSEFSAFGSFTWAATPLFNASISAMWFPDLKGYFAGPTIDYSIAENLDFTLLWQHFDSIISGIRTRINLAFLRIRYSF